MRLPGDVGAIGADRDTGVIPFDQMKWAARGKKGAAGILSVGDVVYVEKVDGPQDTYQLRQVPEIEGALVVMDPHTGRVLAQLELDNVAREIYDLLPL